MIPERIELPAGSVVDKYTIERVLGEGGFGTVYQVTKMGTREKYALKLLRLWETDGPGREKILARFELEFQTGRIDSPYLVHNHDYGEVSGNPYIIMDFCPNGDLRSRLEKQNLNKNLLPPLGINILKGLQSLHQNGKVHRDLKPENILFGADQVARLADFGIAGHKNIKRLTEMNWHGKPTEVFGTYMYMPPEQVQPKSAHVTILPTIDLFAFGVMMFELFTGRLPFGKLETNADLGGYVMNAAQGQFENIKRLNPGVPDAWATTINQCLEPDYRKRPQSVKDVLMLVNGQNTGASQQMQVTADPAPFIDLMIMQGEAHRKIYPVSHMLGQDQSRIFTIGRQDVGVYNDISVQDDMLMYISRMHATLERIDRYPWWIIKDGQWHMDKRTWMPSTNGTYVNSDKVSSFPGSVIKPGDIITLGDTTLKVIKA